MGRNAWKNELRKCYSSTAVKETFILYVIDAYPSESQDQCAGFLDLHNEICDLSLDTFDLTMAFSQHALLLIILSTFQIFQGFLHSLFFEFFKCITKLF